MLRHHSQFALLKTLSPSNPKLRHEHEQTHTINSTTNAVDGQYHMLICGDGLYKLRVTTSRRMSFTRKTRAPFSWRRTVRSLLARELTKHIDMRYFFITDLIEKKEVSVEYCPTEDMIGGFFTKPLQGSLFRKFRALILNTDE